MKDWPLAIIGPGKVGTAIGVLAGRAGWPVAAVGGRDAVKTRAACEAMSPTPAACTPAEAASAGKLVLLTVSDDAIGQMCDALAGENAFAPGSIVAHCCGALSSDVLAPARDRCGCAIGSMHPLQTFPTVQAAIERLGGARIFCEGDDRATAVLTQLAESVGGQPVRLAGGQGKTLYHAGAVMACNYVTAMVDAAVSLMDAAGVDRSDALAALVPMLTATVENIRAMGTADALTGPIARGDSDTVGRHVDAIAALPNSRDAADLAALYAAAGRWTVALAQRKGTIDTSTAGKLTELLAKLAQPRSQRNT